MTPQGTPLPENPLLDPAQSWLNHFEPFGLFHLASLAFFLGLIVLWCWYGRRLLVSNPDSELRFRRRVAWGIIAFQSFGTVWRVLPENLSLEDSIPLHVCRIVGWVVPFMLLTQHRRLRAVVYFWGVGLSTQGLITPMWPDGLAQMDYWLYWIGHMVILGAAAQDIWVHRWGPEFRDWGFATLWGLIYSGAAVALNLWLGTNYSYLGKGEYEAASAVDWLGDWPERPALMVGGAGVIFLMLYLAALAVRWKKNRTNQSRSRDAASPNPAPDSDPA